MGLPESFRFAIPYAVSCTGQVSVQEKPVFRIFYDPFDAFLDVGAGYGTALDDGPFVRLD